MSFSSDSDFSSDSSSDDEIQAKPQIKQPKQQAQPDINPVQPKPKRVYVKKVLDEEAEAKKKEIRNQVLIKARNARKEKADKLVNEKLAAEQKLKEVKKKSKKQIVNNYYYTNDKPAEPPATPRLKPQIPLTPKAKQPVPKPPTNNIFFV